MINRMYRAVRLDPLLFQQVAQNNNIEESLLISVVVAGLTASGAALAARYPLLAFLLELVNSLLLGWFLWAAISVQVARQMGVKLDITVMRRMLAYASVPRLLLFFGFIPCFGWIFRVAGWTMCLLAGVMGIREFSGPGIRSALLPALVGLLPYLIASAAINLIFGGLPMVGL